MQVTKDELQGVLNQVNRRFDWFTNEVAKLNKRIEELEQSATNPSPAKTTAKEKAA